MIPIELVGYIVGGFLVLVAIIMYVRTGFKQNEKGEKKDDDTRL